MTKKEVKERARELAKNVLDMVMANANKGPRPWVPGSKTLFGKADQAMLMDDILEIVTEVIDSGGIEAPGRKKRSGAALTDDDDEVY